MNSFSYQTASLDYICLLTYLCGGLLTIGMFSDQAHAEFSCVVDVTYKWTRDSKDGEGAASPSSRPTASPTAQTTPQPESDNVVHVAMVEQRAETQELAKQLLGPDVNRSKVKAAENCQREHESLSLCTGTKFQLSASVMSSIGFSARRELEKSILTDCRRIQGRCLGVTASEATCAEVVGKPTPVPSVAAAPDKGAEKKKK